MWQMQWQSTAENADVSVQFAIGEFRDHGEERVLWEGH